MTHLGGGSRARCRASVRQLTHNQYSRSLPDRRSARLRTAHRVALATAEGLVEFGQVREWPVHPEPRRRVRVGEQSKKLRLVADDRPPHLGVRDEEALLGREAVELVAPTALLQRVLQPRVRDLHPAEVADVLAERELPVPPLTRERLVRVELLDHELRPLLICPAILGG